jgi:hypothetical protein
MWTRRRPAHLVGISAAWRKLIMQAEMAAPHVQVAALEGEPGSGKQTLARYLFSRSPLAASTFQRRDAREWLVADADPATLAGFTYLDRVDLLAPPGQGLLLGVLKGLQDRPPGRAVLLASSQTPLRQWPVRDCSCPTSPSASPPSASPFPPCASAAKTSPPSPSPCSTASASAISSAPSSSAPARSRASSSTTGPATSASSPPSSKPPCSKLKTASSAPTTSPSPPTARKCNRDLHSASRADDLSLDAMIRHHVQYVLDLNRGNKLRAARQLCISRSTLYRILGNETILAH